MIYLNEKQKLQLSKYVYENTKEGMTKALHQEGKATAEREDIINLASAVSSTAIIKAIEYLITIQSEK
jgi:hypothetical protein